MMFFSSLLFFNLGNVPFLATYPNFMAVNPPIYALDLRFLVNFFRDLYQHKVLNPQFKVWNSDPKISQIILFYKYLHCRCYKHTIFSTVRLPYHCQTLSISRNWTNSVIFKPFSYNPSNFHLYLKITHGNKDVSVFQKVSIFSKYDK